MTTNIKLKLTEQQLAIFETILVTTMEANNMQAGTVMHALENLQRDAVGQAFDKQGESNMEKYLKYTSDQQVLIMDILDTVQKAKEDLDKPRIIVPGLIH